MKLLMKNLMFAAIALSFVACTGAEEAPKKAVPTCSADCSGALAGNPDNQCNLYNSREYQSGFVSCEFNEVAGTCDVITTECVDIPKGAVFAPCTGGGQGDCEDGLDCFAKTPTESVCLLPCQDDTACVDMESGPGLCIATSQSNSAGHCFKQTSKTNEACGWEGYSLCESSTDQCTSTKTSLTSVTGGYQQQSIDFRCKPVCNPAQANACGAGSCLKAPNEAIMGVESSASHGVAITSGTPNDFRDCDSQLNDANQCSAGFECISLRFNNGTTGEYCTLFEHWCGESATFCDAFDRVGMTVCSTKNPCNISPNYDMCSVVGATDTPANTTCWGSLQINGNDLYPICVASCENERIFNSTGDDLKILDCGTGYTCKAPEIGKELDFTHQSVVDSSFAATDTCTEDSDCDTSRDFVCVVASQNEPKSCNRPTKVCIAE